MRGMTSLALLSAVASIAGDPLPIYHPTLTPEERMRRLNCLPRTNGVEPKQPETETRQMRRARERKERKVNA